MINCMVHERLHVAAFVGAGEYQCVAEIGVGLKPVQHGCAGLGVEQIRFVQHDEGANVTAVGRDQVTIQQVFVEGGFGSDDDEHPVNIGRHGPQSARRVLAYQHAMAFADGVDHAVAVCAGLPSDAISGDNQLKILSRNAAVRDTGLAFNNYGPSVVGNDQPDLLGAQSRGGQRLGLLRTLAPGKSG